MSKFTGNRAAKNNAANSTMSEEDIMTQKPVIDEEEPEMKNDSENMNEELNCEENPDIMPKKRKKGWKFWTIVGCIGTAAAVGLGLAIKAIVNAVSECNDEDNDDSTALLDDGDDIIEDAVDDIVENTEE